MNNPGFVAILAFFLFAASFSGCGSSGGNLNAHNPATSAGNAQENANTARTNAEELRLLVSVPFEVQDEDVVWKENATHKKLIAVFRFSKADGDKIVGEASARRAPENVTVSSETWFPPELIAQGEMSGDDSLRGTAYAADSFFQEPYTSGRIVRVQNTDYFILELAAN